MIPDEAVAAAGEFLPPVWTSNPVYRAELIQALEAAAPHLMAAAWLEGYGKGEIDGALGTNGHEPPDQRNPYREPSDAV